MIADSLCSFQLTDWMAHVPKDVLAKNFQTDISTFDKIPGKELYIFPARTLNSTPGEKAHNTNRGFCP